MYAYIAMYADVGYCDDYDNDITVSAMTKSVTMQMLAMVMIMTML